MFLAFGFLIAHSFSVSYAKDKINADLINKLGYSVSILNVKILHNTIDDHYQYAYCGTSNGLLIIDVSVLNMPKKIVFFEIGKVRDVEFFNMDNGTYKNVALIGEKGLRLYDISDPIKPTYAGGHDTEGDAQSIAIQDHYAFLADGKSGLQVIDISDKENLVLIGACDTPGKGIRVAISGHFAFLADFENGLQAIDISNKEDPLIIGLCDILLVLRKMSLYQGTMPLWRILIAAYRLLI